jgi:hypothetical protein
MEYPIYILDVEGDDRLIVDAIGMVQNPAIEREWMAFSKQQQLFNVVSEEKMILAGPLMVADLPIERLDGAGNKFYVTFPAKTILKIVQKIKKRGLKLSLNFDHNPMNTVESAYLLNDFIISEKMGIKTPTGFGKLSDGSWFGVVQFENKEDFEAAKLRSGFSVEGYFNEMYLKDEEELIIEKLRQKINQYEESN